MFIKVFGIQRTGTNYLDFLVHNNFKLDEHTGILNDSKFGWPNETGWNKKFHRYNGEGAKHWPVPRFDNIDETLHRLANNKAIIIIKNPYTWHTSISNFMAGVSEFSFNGFLGKTTPHYFNKYNCFYDGHRDFLLGDTKGTAYTDSILIRYEDLIVDVKTELQRAANKFNVPLNTEFLDTNEVANSALFTEERRNYYINQKPSYDKETIERVNDLVDWELMKFYGYSKGDF
jgi:hypothetical protein